MQRTTVAQGCIRLFFSAPGSSTIKPAVFLDRDGVINERVPGHYVTNWHSFQLVPGITQAVHELSALKLPIIIVSNQAGVGRGLLTQRVLRQITRRFVEGMKSDGARIDAVYYCPHTPEAGCACRKPRSGLLEQAARDWGVELAASVLVGDSESDIVAANAVGCRAVAFSAQGMDSNTSAHAVAAVRGATELPLTLFRIFGMQSLNYSPTNHRNSGL